MRLIHVGYFAAVFFASGLGSTDARGGIDPTVLIEKSNTLELRSSHVVVGRFIGLTRIAPGISKRQVSPEGRSIETYLAEVEVESVEKGSGIQPGDKILASFWSAQTAEELMTQYGGFGCADYTVVPRPGQIARVYLDLDGQGRWRTDYPSHFFALKINDPLYIRGDQRSVVRKGVEWPTRDSLGILSAGEALVLAAIVGFRWRTVVRS